MLIGVVVCGIVEDYTLNLCQGIEHMSEKNDVHCVVIPIKFLDLNYEAVLENKYGFCYNSNASYSLLSCFDGLIIEMASVLMYTDDDAKKRFSRIFDTIPHVFVSFDDKDSYSVCLDNKAGLMEAMEYMYNNGARKYAMLGGTPNNVDAIIRKECFEEFMAKYAIPYDEEKQYIDGSFFLDCGDEAEKLVRNNMDADVYICANDLLARQMFEACKKLGRKPGRGVSVLGFDDSDFCMSAFPTISSVRTDIVEAGKQAFMLLMEAIEKKPVHKVLVPSKFVLRDSVCHRDSNDVEELPAFKFEDIIISNVLVENNQQLYEVGEIINEISDILNHVSEYPIDQVLDKLYSRIEDIFVYDNLKCLDWEKFVNYTERRYREWCDSVETEEDRNKITRVLIKFLKMMTKVIRKIDPERDINKIYQTLGMECFFRDSMQFVRNTEANYARFLNNISFLGIQNACLYLYDEAIPYMQGERFDVPEYLNLKAVLKEGQIVPVSHSQQKIRAVDIFENTFFDWEGYSRSTLFPVYSDNYLYGVILCDIKKRGYEQSELYVNQVGAGIRMLNLRIENNRIVDEYEESVRRLKENNITLDTMSKTDPLTGLNNRRGFFVRCDKLQGMFPNDNVSVLLGYVDMNDLKIINDRFGHDDGDFALKTIGTLLTDFVTMNNGFAARIGGDEFVYVIIVPKDSNIEKFRDELYNLFDQFNVSSLRPYKVEVCIGDCIISVDNNMTIEDALRQADERLYYEKSTRKQQSIIKVNSF